jgi:hypothetical protein
MTLKRLKRNQKKRRSQMLLEQVPLGPQCLASKEHLLVLLPLGRLANYLPQLPQARSFLLINLHLDRNRLLGEASFRTSPSSQLLVASLTSPPPLNPRKVALVATTRMTEMAQEMKVAPMMSRTSLKMRVLEDQSNSRFNPSLPRRAHTKRSSPQ